MSHEPHVTRQERRMEVVNYFKTSSIIPIFKYIFFAGARNILILGKLINKLKHHLSPGLLVLYGQVVKNGNKTKLPQLQIAIRKPQSLRWSETRAKFSKWVGIQIVVWLHYWGQLIMGLACAINNVSFFVFMSSLGILSLPALTNQKQAFLTTGQWEAGCWHPVKPFCDAVSAWRCRWTDGVPPLSPQNIINYTSQLHQYNRRKT